MNFQFKAKTIDSNVELQHEMWWLNAKIIVSCYQIKCSKRPKENIVEAN